MVCVSNAVSSFACGIEPFWSCQDSDGDGDRKRCFALLHFVSFRLVSFVVFVYVFFFAFFFTFFFPPFTVLLVAFSLSFFMLAVYVCVFLSF